MLTGIRDCDFEARRAAETSRIAAEYERRSSALPSDLYALNRPANLFAHVQTARACIAALSAEGCFPLEDKSIADVGCGTGTWLLEFLKWGARGEALHGIDLNEKRIAQARERLPRADLRTGDACALPWPSESFDIVTQYTVFTSVLDDAVKAAMADEIMRVLKPSGLLLWYDFCVNNPANPHVKAVRVREMRALFAGCQLEVKRVTLAPPIARRLAPLSWPAALVLEAIPFLRTHLLGVVRRSA